MLRYGVAVVFLALVAADTFCNYAITGDEILVEAVPIGTYETSGKDTPRASWCIAGCDTKVSVKGTLLLLEAGPGPKTSYKMHRHVNMKDRTIYREIYNQKTGELVRTSDGDGDNTFCIDDTVAAQVDAVFDKYNTVDNIVKGLNATINKPGWAYLVIEHVDDSVGEGANLKFDTNFCYKNTFKQINNQYYFFDVVAMAVDDRNSL
ncbi:unnamed protein product, partial [Mesorhabditis belari]|uniref:Uncharacterized protein n=1 Tax=Mesorhabditis belari TaxID=2138241 RepID=A0AAF3FL65_9BILA